MSFIILTKTTLSQNLGLVVDNICLSTMYTQEFVNVQVNLEFIICYIFGDIS